MKYIFVERLTIAIDNVHASEHFDRLIWRARDTKEEHWTLEVFQLQIQRGQ